MCTSITVEEGTVVVFIGTTKDTLVGDRQSYSSILGKDGWHAKHMKYQQVVLRQGHTM